MPKADQSTGLITTGPYRLVRHPIYLGFTLLAMGQAGAFGSWPACFVVLFGIAPTFAGSFSDPNFDGNVGSGLLKRFVVTFDYSHQTMYLKRVEPPPADKRRFDRSGMWINAATDAYEVKSIAANSPAAQAGLAERDLITSLNGQRAVAERLSDAREMLRALPAGTEVSVVFKRGGAEQRTTLKLRDQI